MVNYRSIIYSIIAAAVTVLAQSAGAVGLSDVPNTHQGKFLPQADNIGQALTSTKGDLFLRWRYEDVTDDIPDASPLAATDKAYGAFARFAAGLTTGRWNGFYARAQVEMGLKIGSDKALNLDDDLRVPPTPAANRIAEGYAVIPDNEYTEWNEAFVGWRAPTGGCPNSPDPCNGNFSFKLGRQEIIYDNHRWVGNILWRNNFQTYDAFRVDATPVQNLNVSVTYLDTVRRALGSDSIFYKFEMDDSYLLNASYTFQDIGKLTAYGYILDFDDNRRTPFVEGTGLAPPFVGPVSFDSETFGARWVGTHKLFDTTDILTEFEYANQNPTDDAAGFLDDNDYYNIELGVRFGGTRVDGLGLMPIGEPTFQLKVGQEVLEGNGNNGLQTPLSTFHAFQGWADKFIGPAGGTATPVGGIEDTSVNFQVLGLFGKWIGKNKINIVYHEYEADKTVAGLSDYGDEWNALWGKPNLFGINGLLGAIKYADYQEDCDGPAPANLGLVCVDTEKWWLMLQFTHK